MNVAVANPVELPFKKFLVYSLTLHGGLFLAILISAWLQIRGNEWSGTGGELGSAKVSLVASAGIPMPKEPIVTDSKAFDPTRSLYKVDPPKLPEPKLDATKIPKFEKEKPLPPSHPSKTFESKTPPPANAVPGKGGNPDIPTGNSQTPGSSAGVAMLGQGGGDFASRYGWYIEAATRRIEGNWDVLSLDPVARNSRTLHCAVTFTINRDGTLKNPQITEPSGNLSWDNAALRAVLSSSPLPPLPGDYSGAYVNATYDFPRSRR